MADLSVQGMWVEVSSPAVEPEALSRSRVLAVGASFASDGAATSMPGARPREDRLPVAKRLCRGPFR